MQKNVVDIFYNQMTNIIQDTQEPSSGGQEIEFQEIESFFDQEIKSFIIFQEIESLNNALKLSIS